MKKKVWISKFALSERVTHWLKKKKKLFPFLITLSYSRFIKMDSFRYQNVVQKYALRLKTRVEGSFISWKFCCGHYGLCVMILNKNFKVSSKTFCWPEKYQSTKLFSSYLTVKSFGCKIFEFSRLLSVLQKHATIFCPKLLPNMVFTSFWVSEAIFSLP